MSSKGRKIAKNLGKSLRKKFDSDSQTDDLHQRVPELNLPQEHTAQQLAEDSDMKSSCSSSPSAGAIGKSTSLSTIGNEPADSVMVDHSQILALTHDVKNFSDTLAKLKVLFIEGLEVGDDARVVLQNALGEVLAVLKNTMQRYQDLKTPDIFTAARVLINKIKAHNSEELQLDEEELQFYLDAIDQVALAFSRSVSEYLMGDMVTQQQLNTDTKVMSCDDIAKATHQEEPAVDKQEQKKTLTAAELDAVLVGLEAGLDLALQRAKAWSRYIRDIISYIEKKSQLEMEYAKNLSRIANGMQPVLTNEGFLPLQSVFCTALTQDAEFASNLQASQALLHTSKFVEPLASRRSDHDRMRKTVKEAWDRELRKMQDTVSNLRKAQALYVSRQQELERVRETIQKADGEKMEKRKKYEEEAMHKSAEAETTYKACVAEANHRQRALEKVKVELLGKVREQIYLCDQIIKSVTVDYFSLLHTVWSPVPVQYQTLCESSRSYEPGCQYGEFIKRLPSSASRPSRSDQFTFEAYSPGQKAGETRKISVHSNGSSGEHVHSNEGSPISSPRRDKYRIPVKAWGQGSVQSAVPGGSDTDSASGSNNESSPSSSPHDQLRRQIVSSQSLEDLAEEEGDRLPATADQKRAQMKRTMTVGGEDSLEIPGMMGQGRRNTMFGVDFQEQVERYRTQVPPIITKCLAEIERRGVMIKGIYRVSGVKSKVENLCQRFDLNPQQVDLEEVHPNIISNVLKLYLRQLPEPLLTFRLYSDFIHLAKENMAGYLVGDKMVERLAALVRKLPTSNYRTCAVLMHHLYRVAAHSELNQMSSSNLGIVFGPTLLRPLEGTASLASLVDTPHQTRAVELLISNAEVVFGPGDDYQLVPDQTPVESLQQAAKDLSIAVPSSSSEPSPEKSPTKESGETFQAPVPPSVSSGPATTVSTTPSSPPPSSPPPPPPPFVPPPSAPPPVPAAGHVEDSTLLVSDVDNSTPSLQPSAGDFTLPGSAGPDRYDNVFVSKTSGALADGQALSTDSDEASLSTLEDDDDDDDDDHLAEVMLPDQSKASNSQSHTPLLTPQCMAEWKSVGNMTADSKTEDVDRTGRSASSAMVDTESASLSSLRTVALMESSTRSTADSTQPPTFTDCSTWPGSAGYSSASLPSSPTMQPLHSAATTTTTTTTQPMRTPSSSSCSSLVSDGRLSPTKGDSRADRFKLEQRKLLSAIKSDPKLAMAAEEVGLTRPDGRLSTIEGEDGESPILHRSEARLSAGEGVLVYKSEARLSTGEESLVYGPEASLNTGQEGVVYKPEAGLNADEGAKPEIRMNTSDGTLIYKPEAKLSSGEWNPVYKSEARLNTGDGNVVYKPEARLNASDGNLVYKLDVQSSATEAEEETSRMTQTPARGRPASLAEDGKELSLSPHLSQDSKSQLQRPSVSPQERGQTPATLKGAAFSGPVGTSVPFTTSDPASTSDPGSTSSPVSTSDPVGSSDPVSTPDQVDSSTEEGPGRLGRSSKAARLTVVELSEKTETKIMPQLKMSASSGEKAGKGKKLERSSSGSKLLGTADSPGSSGMRHGAGSPVRVESSGTGSSSQSTPGKYSGAAVSKGRPASIGAGQRRSNITGFSSSSSPSPSPTRITPTRSVLSRYPPASSTPPSSPSRRPGISQSVSTTSVFSASTTPPPSPSRRPGSSHSASSTDLYSASGTGTRSPSASSVASTPRATTMSISSAGAGRQGLETSRTTVVLTTSQSSQASAGRARRTSGDKTGSSASVSLYRAGSGGSAVRSSAGSRSASGSARATSTGAGGGGGGGKGVSGSAAFARSGSNGGAGIGARVTSTATKTSSASILVRGDSSGAGRGAASSGSVCRRYHEKSQEDKSGEKSSPSSGGAKDLSSDRTPRFV